MSSKPLETEMAYFKEHREAFLEKAAGKYILIKGKEDHGFFDTEESAYKTGVNLFGLEPFLITEVISENHIHEIPAHFLGLIHANC